MENRTYQGTLPYSIINSQSMLQSVLDFFRNTSTPETNKKRQDTSLPHHMEKVNVITLYIAALKQNLPGNNTSHWVLIFDVNHTSTIKGLNKNIIDPYSDSDGYSTVDDTDTDVYIEGITCELQKAQDTTKTPQCTYKKFAYDKITGYKRAGIIEIEETEIFYIHRYISTWFSAAWDRLVKKKSLSDFEVKLNCHGVIYVSLSSIHLLLKYFDLIGIESEFIPEAYLGDWYDAAPYLNCYQCDSPYT